jgi:hypothetical protein
VFTARYALNPYIKQIRLAFKGLNYAELEVQHGCVFLFPKAISRYSDLLVPKAPDSLLRHANTPVIFFLAVKGPAADATDAPQPCGLLCTPVMKMTVMMIIFVLFLIMEHRWNETDRGKPKYSGKNLSQCHFVQNEQLRIRRIYFTLYI